MKNNLIEINPKENFYYFLKVVFGIIGYALIIFLLIEALERPGFLTLSPILLYGLVIAILLIFRLGLLVGYLKGNSIRINNTQFQDINKIVQNQCESLGIKDMPKVYIMQNGGLLNAFATRFLGSNYIVIYSDIIEEAYENNFDSLEFVIGHELGHIKRRHLTKSLIWFPSFLIPFLNKAYSRACEYTCDNIAFNLNSKGAISGLLLIAAGKKVWKKVNVAAYINQGMEESGFWTWFAEKVSSHPNLTKRLVNLGKKDVKLINTKNIDVVESEKVVIKEIHSDHSAYMPR